VAARGEEGVMTHRPFLSIALRRRHDAVGRSERAGPMMASPTKKSISVRSQSNIGTRERTLAKLFFFLLMCGAD